MDPVTVGAALATIAGGAAGALGSRLWAEASALVRRPFHRAAEAHGQAVAGGAAELAALQQVPGDQARAMALAELLVAHAADSTFGEALAGWWEQGRQIQAAGNVASTITGGTQYGPVLQGRFTGLAFATAPVPPVSPAPDPGA
jgi:hypothetical protein